MEIIDGYLSQWRSILNRVKIVGGKIKRIKVASPAKLREIEKIESILGFLLPDSFRNVLLNFSKYVYFEWEIPDASMPPEELRRLSYGRFGWNINWLEYNSDISKGLLPLHPLGNGDYLMFDLREISDDPPIIYWDHEEEECYFIAENFFDYLEKITALKCIEPDYFNLELFTSNKGLDTETLLSKKWINWFETFTITEFDKVAKNLNKLIEYIVYVRQVKYREIKALQAFEFEAIMNAILKKLNKVDEYDAWPLCWIIGEVIGEAASEWVEQAWKIKKISVEKRAYLSSRCLSKELGLSYVYYYLENRGSKVSSYTALQLLGHFHSNMVIKWMNGQVSWPVTEGWDKLFALSNPTWRDISEWATISEVHRGVIANSLYHIIQDSTYEAPIVQPEMKIIDPPTKMELLNFIENLPEEREFKKRKYLREELIKNIDKFYII